MREHRRCGAAVTEQTAPEEPLPCGREAEVDAAGPNATGHGLEATTSLTHEAVPSSDLRAAATTFLPARAAADDPPAAETDEASLPALEEAPAEMKRWATAATSTGKADEPAAEVNLVKSTWAPVEQGGGDGGSSQDPLLLLTADTPNLSVWPRGGNHTAVHSFYDTYCEIMYKVSMIFTTRANVGAHMEKKPAPAQLK